VTQFPYRRALALMVLAGLFLWNAPAMAFPALLEQVTECASTPAAPTSAPAHHHHRMLHAAMPELSATPLASAALCLVAHPCCSFNR